MARLSAEQWEQARAEYEVRGVSLGEVAKAFGVATSSVSRRARAEGWTQGKMQDLVERKVAAAKEMQAVETQMQELPLRFQLTLQEGGSGTPADGRGRPELCPGRGHEGHGHDQGGGEPRGAGAAVPRGAQCNAAGGQGAAYHGQRAAACPGTGCRDTPAPCSTGR